MMGPPKPMLGSKLEGTTLRAVVRWKGADPRTRANREPWKWEEHGLAMASPRQAAGGAAGCVQWRSARQRRAELRQRREAGATLERTAAHQLVTADVLAQHPGLSEAQLCRAASYCGRSKRRFAAYLEEFARQDTTEAQYDCGDAATSVVAEHCVEQEELLATGRYVRVAEPARTPTRRRRKPPLITRAASEPAPSTDSEQERTDNQSEQDGVTSGDSVGTGLTDLGPTVWAGTEHSINGGLLVLGEDGEPESYHALKHPETRSSQLLPADKNGIPTASSDSCSDEEESGELGEDQQTERLDSESELEAELESLIKTTEHGCVGHDVVAGCMDAGRQASRPESPIQAYLRLERRPTTSAHAHHDHVKAEAAFTQLRAQLADFKQRPHTSPLSLPGAGPSKAASRTTSTAVQSEIAKACSSVQTGTARKDVSRTSVPLVPTFGGMPASQAAGGYRRGRSGIASPTAGIGGSGVVESANGSNNGGSAGPIGETRQLGLEPSSNKFTAKLNQKDTARSNIATPPNSPPKPKPMNLAKATIRNSARVEALSDSSLDPVYRAMPARSTSTAAPTSSSTMRTATWMSISAPSLPSSSMVAVDIQARVAGTYANSVHGTRPARVAARGALSRQRQAVGAAVHNAMTLRKMHAVRTGAGSGLSRAHGRGRLEVTAGATF